MEGSQKREHVEGKYVFIYVRRVNEERLPIKKVWNGVHLEEEVKENLEIRGCGK